MTPIPRLLTRLAVTLLTVELLLTLPPMTRPRMLALVTMALTLQRMQVILLIAELLLQTLLQSSSRTILRPPLMRLPLPLRHPKREAAGARGKIANAVND